MDDEDEDEDNDGCVDDEDYRPDGRGDDAADADVDDASDYIS